MAAIADIVNSDTSWIDAFGVNKRDLWPVAVREKWSIFRFNLQAFHSELRDFSDSSASVSEEDSGGESEGSWHDTNFDFKD